MNRMDTYWSPEPITGYRVWNVFHDRVQGFFSVWRGAAFEARCSKPDPATAVPHDDDVCECGVYAAKHPEWLTKHFAGSGRPRVAMGRVELSGRVIEHTDGYRAQRAQAVDLAVRTRAGVFHFQDPADTEELFTNPHAALLRHENAVLPMVTNLAELVAD